MDIVLPAGTPLAGFGGTPRREFTPQTIALAAQALAGICLDPDFSDAATFFKPSQGTHDPARVRALVLSNTLRKIGIVKLDTIGASRKLRDDVFTVAATLGIKNEDLVVLATHTHSGPGAVADQRLWQVAASDCFSQLVYEQVRKAAVDALMNANAALQPAALGVGTTAQALASENRRDRPWVYDSEIGLIKVTTTSGTPLAVLFNFAVHGTSLGASNMLFSADCMGEMERVVENGLPGAVAIFTNGAEGDVAPKHRDFAGAQIQGQLVGDKVLGEWPNVATKSSVALAGSFQEVKMPFPRYNTGAGCAPLPETSDTLCDVFPGLPLNIGLSPKWLPTKLPFQALRIDDSVFVAIPGEPITEIGWSIKLRAASKGFAHGFVLGLANDHGGYFTTRAEYNRGTYEGQSTMYGPDTGEIVVDSADCVMSHVK